MAQELKAFGIRGEENGRLYFAEVYKKQDVDAVLAEMDAEIARLKATITNGDVNCACWLDRALELEATERRLKRALWLTRAYRAEARKNYWYARSCHEGDKYLWSIDGSAVKYIGCIKRTNFDWLKTWSEVEIKCREMAEKFKG